MTTTTTNLQPVYRRSRLNGLPLPLAIAVVVFAMLAIAALAGRIQSSPSTAPAPTPSLPIIVIQKEAPAQPAQQVIYQQVPAAAPLRWVTAFAAPDGAVLGPIVAPELGAITGRYGDGWISTMHEGATVWLRTSELGANLANLAPAIAPQPALAPQLQYQTSNQPEPPPPTPEPAAQPALVVAPLVEAPAAAPVQQEQFPRIVKSEIPYVARPGGPSEVDYQNTVNAWKQEHCHGSGAAEVCTP